MSTFYFRKKLIANWNVILYNNKTEMGSGYEY